MTAPDQRQVSEPDDPYRPRAAPADLAGHVVCSWDATMSGAVDLVPDGCVELMWLAGRGLLVCGPETQGWRGTHAQPVRASGVRLRPGAARAVLGLPVDELTDQRVALGDLLPSGRVRALHGRTDDGGAASRVLLGLVRETLADAPTDALATVLPHAIQGSDGMAGLADDLGITTRHLHRRSVELFGYGPSTLRSILRLQGFLALHKQRGDLTLAALAAMSGYTDQSHLARDCRRFTGLTPFQLVNAPQGDWHGEGAVVDVRSVQDAR